MQNTPEQIFEQITKAKNILLHLHPNPDNDSLGSALAIKHVLKNIGKTVTVIRGDSEPRPFFSCMPGFDSIVAKKFNEVDLSQFDTFIAVDSSTPEQVSREGVMFPPHLVVIVIDHHKTNTRYGTYNYVDTESPAAAQVVYDMFKKWNVPISEEAALCLLVGIYGDTGGFKYPMTTQKTFAAAAELAAIAPNFTKLFTEIEQNKELGEIELLGLGIQNLEKINNGTVLLSAISTNDLQTKGITREQTQLALNSATFISIAGCELAVSLIELDTNNIRGSFRSKHSDIVDASLLAKKFNGGGHATAAGASFSGELKDVKEKIILAVKELYPKI